MRAVGFRAMRLCHGRRLAGTLAGLALVTLSAGCGSEAADRGTTPAAPRAAGLSECERLGLVGPEIETSRDAEGTCRGGGGQMVTLAGFGRTVRLRDLSFRVNGARTAKRLSRGPVAETARGVFVVVSITLVNESRADERVAKNQFQLMMDDRRHHFDRQATVLAGPESLWRLTADGLRPGATITGDAIFDVPHDLGAELISRGFLAGASFATVAAGRPVVDEPIGLSPLS